MSSVTKRPALVPVPTNASVVTSSQKIVNGAKRSREEDPDDTTATRSSAKRLRLDVTPRSVVPIPSFDITACTPDSKVHFQEKPKDLGVASKGLDLPKDARSSKKSQADKEKARVAKQEAEELFRQRYRAAFPEWRFYFDGVPLGAVHNATRKIEQLGARIEHVLSNEVTHYITPARIDKDKENDGTHKKLSISNPLASLRSPFDLKTGYDPVDRAKKWGCKIWDISKLESVLERTLARPAKAEAASASTQPSSLQGLLSLEKSSTASAKPAPVPLFRPTKPQGSFNLSNAALPRKLPPPFHSNTTIAMRDRKLNPASRALVGLLKTEKATNTTMERDPRCQRHDYTYFSKLSAFLIIEAVSNDHQVVGRLEFKPKSTSASLSLSITPRAMALDARGAFHAAHRGASGKELPEYPLLHLDHRMRSPFQPYSARAGHKEVQLEHKERQDKADREQLVRWFRANKRAEREHTFRKAMSMSDLRAAAATATHHAHDASLDQGDRASGFIRSTVGTGAYDSMAASGSVASFSTALTGSGYPPTTSRLSLSQSGGGDGHTKFFAAAGVVPSFGGVRNATQVVMNRGAFAEGGTAGSRPRTTSLTRTASTAGGVTVPAEKCAEVSVRENGLRRTQSLATIKPVQQMEVEKKKPEGYCECCKEQYDSLAEHVKGRKHRKFASDPRRYKELDFLIQRLARTTKSASRANESTRTAFRAQARERYHQMMNSTLKDVDAAASKAEADFSGELTMKASPASEDDADKTFSSSLGLDQFFLADTSFELPLVESGPATTNTSACITPVEEAGSGAAFYDTMAPSGTQQEVIVISSDSSAVDSFDVALTGFSAPQPPAPRPPYKGTPMPSRRTYAECLDSTDPASTDGSPESEALVDVLKRRKMQALEQAAQTSEREEDSDGLQIIEA